LLIPIRNDNPTTRLPVMTAFILLANVGVFLYAKLLGVPGFDVFIASWGAIPFELTHGVDAISPTPSPVYVTLITSMFQHGGWLHIAGNMLYLWIFGRNIEDVFGHSVYVLFYLVCGVLGTLAHIVAAPESTVPMVGASGAIAGILGAYLAAFPNARVHVLVPIFFFIKIMRVPAVLVLLMWFLVQVFNVWIDGDVTGGGVAWYAHIGGFVAGYLLMKLKNWGRGHNEVY
jgi:membrane associated rhomboid family serine protease